jgi:hypothetical protein
MFVLKIPVDERESDETRFGKKDQRNPRGQVGDEFGRHVLWKL